MSCCIKHNKLYSLFVCPGCNDGQASLVCELTVPLSLTILPVTGGDGVGFLCESRDWNLDRFVRVTTFPSNCHFDDENEYLYRWTEDACACNDCTSLRSYSWCFPWCISSFVNDASWSPRSCRYMQSGFGQAWLRIKCEQYFVVPKEVFIVRPSTTILFTASIARSASSWRCCNSKTSLLIYYICLLINLTATLPSAKCHFKKM